MKSFLLLLTVLIITCNAAPCPLPLYYEFTDNFVLSTNDIQKLCTNQFSSYPMNNFTSSNGIKFYNVNFKATYEGSKKQSTGQGTKVKVTGDGLNIVANMNANVSKIIIGKDTFKINIILDGTTVDYLKQVKQGSSNPTISVENINFHPQNFKITYDPEPSSSQKKKLTEAINNKTGTSFESELLNQLKKMSGYMNQNCKQETLSKLFPKPIYQYKYYNDGMSLDMNTQKIQFSTDSKLLMNGLNGTVMNNTDNKCFITQSMQRPSNAHTFISKEFMQNMANQALNSFSQFKKVYLNKDNIRTNIFQWRMMDLQYVMPDVLDKYPLQYQAYLQFTCQALALGDFSLGKQTQDNYQQVKWHCSGFFKNDKNITVTIIDFEIMIRHILNIRITSTFSVYSDRLIIQNIKWNVIDNLNIKNERLAQVFMEDTFNDLRVYTVGTYFKVLDGTNKIVFTDKGLWLSNEGGKNLIKSQ